MAYIYYNCNPAGKAVGDCVIRAISKATRKTWDDTYMDIAVCGYRLCDMPSSNSVWGTYLLENGYRRSIIPNTCSDCYTVADFSLDHPAGTFIVATGTHVVCVLDGDIYDSWDSSNEVPVYYFTKRG